MLFLTTILLFLLPKIDSVCDEKYLTFCDCVSDLRSYDRTNWTDVIIDSTHHDCSSSIRNTTFEPLEEIKLLFVVNSTDDIALAAFKTIGQTIKTLKFYGNRIEHVSEGLFRGFRKLSRLSLTNNGIKSVERFSFGGSVIKRLDLSNNELEMLPEDAFRGGEIKIIFIRNNKLSYINEKAFDGNLEVLRLDYNNLEYVEKCFVRNLVNLKELSLSHNRLTQVSDIKTLENVQKLDLSFNDINFINDGDLEDLKDLVYLDLSSNKLETFSLKTFKKVKTARMTLLLSYNLLTNIKIPDNTKPMTITLFGNPWNCKCLTKMEEEMLRYNFTTSKCNLELTKAGTFPICIEQGECRHRPTESRADLRRFVGAVHERMKHLPCDLFREVKGKDIVSMT